MHKIRLIIQREYLSRVKKKSFIVMTLLGPALMSLVFFMPFIVSKFNEDEARKVIVIDEHPEIFTTVLPSTEEMVFINSRLTLDSAKAAYDPETQFGILYLPADLMKNPGGAMLFSDNKTSISVTGTIEDLLSKQIQEDKLKAEGIDQKVLASTETKVDLKTLSIKGEESSVELATTVGLISGILIYIFIFMYGVQVMRGVIEEKSNRIVELIISSVKPFELMLGKIVGIAMVVLTQFVLWIILTLSLASLGGRFISEEFQKSRMKDVNMSQQAMQQQALEELGATPKASLSASEEIFSEFNRIDFPLIITCFFIYFLGGYLLYSALFAAIGAAVDNETETQQFMLPVTIPLILSFVVAQSVVQQPESSLGFWFSICPLTSPVVMMVRIAFGVSMWELALSISLLIAAFIGATWFAGRIYRTGILMYGKKTTYRELLRWLFYKG